MANIELLRKKIERDYFPDTALYSALGDKKYWCATRLVYKGKIERIKHGLYVFSSDYRKQKLNLFSISNIIYGPSYVSLDSALSFYQLIPEQVIETTCVNPKRTKKFNTPIGRFSYRKIPSTAFPFGINCKATKPGFFIIASKEKALVDKLYLDSSRIDCLAYCLDSLRIEESELVKLNIKVMLELSKQYQNFKFEEQIINLARELKVEQNARKT